MTAAPESLFLDRDATEQRLPRGKQEAAWRAMDAWAQAIQETRVLRKASRPGDGYGYSK